MSPLTADQPAPQAEARSKQPRHEIAIHEAGHAVVARALGVPVYHMEFHAKEEGKPWASCHMNRHPALSPFDWACLCYAGIAAQRRVDPERTWSDNDSDKRKFDAALMTQRERDCAVRWTESILSKHWDDVQRLAAEMDRRDGLYTEELLELGYWHPAPARRGSPSLAAALRWTKA